MVGNVLPPCRMSKWDYGTNTHHIFRVHKRHHIFCWTIVPVQIPCVPLTSSSSDKRGIPCWGGTLEPFLMYRANTLILRETPICAGQFELTIKIEQKYNWNHRKVVPNSPELVHFALLFIIIVWADKFFFFVFIKFFSLSRAWGNRWTNGDIEHTPTIACLQGVQKTPRFFVNDC